MNIAICEDNTAERLQLSQYVEAFCRKYCYECRLSLFASGEDLLQAFAHETFDLILLDIYLPGISGIETARQIRARDNNCTLLFVTVSKEYALEGYEVRALGYILKPPQEQQLESVLQLCRRLFEEKSRIIQVPLGREMLDIPLATLHYVEVLGRSTLFHTSNGELEIRMTMEEAVSKIGGSPFLRCHRCYLVNMNYVADMRELDFVMQNGDVVPIRKNGRKEVKLTMARFLAGQKQLEVNK